MHPHAGHAACSLSSTQHTRTASGGWISDQICSYSDQPTWGAEKKRKKSDVPTYLPFLRFFELLRSDLRKYFYGVFGLLMQRNGQKRDKKKIDGKRRQENFFFSQLFRPKAFWVCAPISLPYRIGLLGIPLASNKGIRYAPRALPRYPNGF